MLTWICPQCGSSVEAAAEVCPRCSGQDAALPPDAEPTLLDAAVPDFTQAAPAAEPGLPGRPAAPDAAASSAALEPQVKAAAPSPPPGAFDLRPRHYVLFAALLAVGILGAVWLAGGLPALRLEEPGEMAESPVETFAIGVSGAIEVSGIRPYYDDDFQAHVRAFVANHSKQEQSVALTVELRVREASRQSPPLATFDVIIGNPLPPAGGQEVDVSLHAMGSLASFPPWDRLRVDIERK